MRRGSRRGHRSPRDRHNALIRSPYPLEIVPRLPEFLGRRRSRFTYPLRLMEELGIDRPALFFLLTGVALQGSDGARMPDIYNPYVTIFEPNLAAASAARAVGLVEELGGKWRATAKGRALADKARAESDAYFASLEPIPIGELRRLAELLGQALSAIERSDVPKDHLPRSARYGGDPRIPMVALDN